MLLVLGGGRMSLSEGRGGIVAVVVARIRSF